MNTKRLEKFIKILIRACGDNPEREGLSETPGRVLRGWSELVSGYACDDREFYKTFDFKGNGLVVVRGIEFTSLCEHHLLPFYGTATVGYVPGEGRVLGLSKFSRIVDCFSKRLQLQERLANDIANSIVNNLRPKDLFLVMRAVHCCMICRGIMKRNSEVFTIVTHGKFKYYNESDIIKLAD
ncbi:MAG: GTP cyclohydrolase I [Rickettsiales bacterium]|jgi:GTP cyclohydrolase I|nr:GTP cyclohydrolase I [Rickettsiales bacterium]